VTLSDPNPVLSICIVNLNAAVYLSACLDSIPSAAAGLSYEVILVDNGSSDNSIEILRKYYPSVQIIHNDRNLGYTLPMNQALRQGIGDYLIQLNPDTLCHPGALRNLYEFMQSNPNVGICSPKVLNRDGTLQRQCRRSAARPWDVISYFSGLWKLFPNDPFYGRYLITYRGDDEIFEVEAVSGSCMVIRREVIDQIGYLDEVYFAYQEDTDFCFRAGKAGWKIFYYPRGVITHFGGEGGSTFQPYQGIYQWHRSYFIYYNRNLAKEYSFLVNGVMYAGMLFKLLISLLTNLVSKKKTVGTKKPQ